MMDHLSYAKVGVDINVTDAAKQNIANADVDSQTILAALKTYLDDQGGSRKDAVKAVAQQLGLPKNKVYQESLQLITEEYDA